MKKFLALSLCLTLILTCFTALLGCGPGFRTYTHGDWVIMHSAEGECLIYDLSEEGKQKEVLTFPTEVAGRKVTGTYYDDGGWYNDGHYIDAPNLKRLYFTEYVELERLAIDTKDGTIIFFLLYDLEIQVDGENYHGAPFVETKHLSYIKNIYPYKQTPLLVFPANVSYYYNYENAPFGGFYWLDDYNGEIIRYLPSIPTREGYKFAGWYKEPACINKWNFETDVVPAKKYEPELHVTDNIYIEKQKYIYTMKQHYTLNGIKFKRRYANEKGISFNFNNFCNLYMIKKANVE